MDSGDDDASRPKYLGDYPDGAYFAAESPPGADEAKPVGKDLYGLGIAVDGEVISMMWDYGMRVPLWDMGEPCPRNLSGCGKCFD